MEALKQLVQFMHPDQRLDLKAVALTHILSLSGSEDGKQLIMTLEEMLTALFLLTKDSNHVVAKDAVLILINLTGDKKDAKKIYTTAKKANPVFAIVEVAVQNITDKSAKLADPWSMVLSNLTRVESLVTHVLDSLENCDKTLSLLAKAFTHLDYNKNNSKLHYLAPIFCNLTQISRGRELICNKRYNLLEKILPFASFEASVVRRGGTIGILKNICFDPVYHDVLLQDGDEFLCAILRPLCGPEEYTDDENEMLPLELQYLPESKAREADPDLRKMLLECLLQLCATKRYRGHLRSKGTYEILREYHKWEAKQGRDKDCLLACENVVDILIKKEEEIGLDNYRSVEVPQETAEKFVKDDADYIKTLLD